MADYHLEAIIYRELLNTGKCESCGSTNSINSEKLSTNIRERIEAEYTCRLKADADMSNLEAK